MAFFRASLAEAANSLAARVMFLGITVFGGTALGHLSAFERLPGFSDLLEGPVYVVLFSILAIWGALVWPAIVVYAIFYIRQQWPWFMLLPMLASVWGVSFSVLDKMRKMSILHQVQLTSPANARK